MFCILFATPSLPRSHSSADHHLTTDELFVSLGSPILCLLLQVLCCHPMPVLHHAVYIVFNSLPDAQTNCSSRIRQLLVQHNNISPEKFSGYLKANFWLPAGKAMPYFLGYKATEVSSCFSDHEVRIRWGDA